MINEESANISLRLLTGATYNLNSSPATKPFALKAGVLTVMIIVFVVAWQVNEVGLFEKSNL
jgi:hypothetical protein